MLETCPHCATEVLFLNEFCPNCHRARTDGRPSPQEATQVAPSQSSSRLRSRVTVIALVAAVAALCLVILGFAGGYWTHDPATLKKQLFEAVRKDNVARVRRLIKRGVDVKSPEAPGGWSPLHFAARNANEEIVKLLLDAGADPDYFGAASGQQGTIISASPLVVAQANLGLAQAMSGNPLLHFADPEEQKRMTSPGFVHKCEAVIKLLGSKTTPGKQ